MPESIKLLEDNIGSIPLDINHRKFLFDSSPRAMEIKTKIASGTEFTLKALYSK